MTKSSKRVAATAAVLALLGLPAVAQPPPASRSGATLGPERTDDPGAVGSQGAARADRPAPDEEPGRNATGRTFSPESASPAVRPPAPDGAKPPPADVPRSPPTGDASGGDRRTEAPATLAQAWREDPDLAGVFAYPHSAGVPLFRRVNDGSEGQAPTPRFHGANPPPEDVAPGVARGRPSRAAPAAEATERNRGASQRAAWPPPATPANPPDARVTGEGAAPPALSSRGATRQGE